jgi:hypothetical protein
MAAYFFRFLGYDNQPNGLRGFVFARTRLELFWAIDQHGDPYSCELKTARMGSLSYRTNLEDPEADEPYGGLELGDCFWRAHYEKKGWKVPTWDDIYPERVGDASLPEAT